MSVGAADQTSKDRNRIACGIKTNEHSPGQGRETETHLNKEVTDSIGQTVAFTIEAKKWSLSLSMWTAPPNPVRRKGPVPRSHDGIPSRVSPSVGIGISGPYQVTGPQPPISFLT